MKVYLFYIKKSILPPEITYTVSMGDEIEVDDGVIYVFYAFTNSKKIKDKFISERIDDFIFFSRNISKEDYDEFAKSNENFRLSYIKYSNKDYDINLLTTRNEFTHCKFGWSELFCEKDTLSSLPYNLVNTIKWKYQEALTKLGLNSLVIAYDEELANLMMPSSLQFDDDCVFNIDDQEYHDKLGKIATVSLRLKPKEYNLYLHEFKKLYKL